MKALADNAHGASEQLQREARAWLRRLRSGKVTERDAQAFRQWRSSGPLHDEAFAEAQRWWTALDPAMAQLLSQDRALADSLTAPRRPVMARRAFLGGAVSVAATAGLAMVYPPFDLWPAVSEWRADYRTGIGEQRRIALTDGVRVDMNTLTAITRREVNGRTVGVQLIAGEAAIDLLAPTRGFAVTAGVGRSVAQTGRFEVRYMDGTACVTCVEGALQIEHPLGTRRLAAGQQTTYERNSLGEVTVIDPEVSSAWREGILVFRHTPLVRVIDEINRYRPGRVVLLDSSVSGREVSGRFSMRALDTVLVQIQRTYNLQARRLPGGLLVLT